ncbi:MAG: hypothetical protein HGA19_20060 [Oscillochloris sp.]|nr:hypothetical protein [Oscillochloris sp.]
MKKLGANGRAWLKGFHILFTAAWVGAAVCMILLHFSYRPGTGSETHTVLAALKRIDDWVIIPSAIGSLLTGLLISWLTPWGFFKWRWVTVKWIGTIAVMLFGTFCLGPWLNGMEAMAAANPQSALQDPTFLSNRQLMSYAVGPQLFLLLFMVFISVLKPWKRSTRTREA